MFSPLMEFHCGNSNVYLHDWHIYSDESQTGQKQKILLRGGKKQFIIYKNPELSARAELSRKFLHCSVEKRKLL